jgi:hypothetical protein
MWSPDALAEKPCDLRAPLRNRTVDLLLTMANQPVPIASAYGLSRLNTGSRQRRLAETSPAWLQSAPQIAPEMIF